MNIKPAFLITRMTYASPERTVRYERSQTGCSKRIYSQRNLILVFVCTNKYKQRIHMIRNTIKTLFVAITILMVINTTSMVSAADTGSEIIYVKEFDIAGARAAKSIPMISPEERELINLDKRIREEVKAKAAREREIQIEKERITERAKKIREYLVSRGAPLAEYAEEIVTAGEKHGVEPELIAAISIIESGGGKINFRAYNAWGWGRKSWPNWETAIDEYAQGLARGYISKGADTPSEIAPIYCPPNRYAWARNVTNVLNALKG